MGQYVTISIGRIFGRPYQGSGQSPCYVAHLRKGFAKSQGWAIKPQDITVVKVSLLSSALTNSRRPLKVPTTIYQGNYLGHAKG